MRFQLAYVGIQVRDIERSLACYRDILGMRIVRRARVPETKGEWVQLRSPDSRLLLELDWYPEGSKFFAGPYRRGDALDHIPLYCEDVEGAYRQLLAKGVRSAQAPFMERRSLLARVRDPGGLCIE